MAPTQVRVSVPAVKAVFELGPIIILNVSPTRHLVPAHKIVLSFRSRPSPLLAPSSLISPARTHGAPVQYDATGVLSRRPTRTRPVSAEAEEAEASAGELAFSAVVSSDAGGGAPHPATTDLVCIDMSASAHGDRESIYDLCRCSQKEGRRACCACLRVAQLPRYISIAVQARIHRQS